MRKTITAALATATALTFAPAAHAGGGVTTTAIVVHPSRAIDGPVGATCGMTAVPDLTPGGAGWYDAAIEGGPLALVTFGSPIAVYTGTVTCTVQVNGSHHSAPDAAAPVAGNGLGVVTATGTRTFAALPSDNVYLCTQVDLVNGPTLYWDGVVWTTSPFSPCSLAVTGTVDDRELDPIICPVLALIFPPEGDIPGVWDCPPYGW